MKLQKVRKCKKFAWDHRVSTVELEFKFRFVEFSGGECQLSTQYSSSPLSYKQNPSFILKQQKTISQTPFQLAVAMRYKWKLLDGTSRNDSAGLLFSFSLLLSRH